MKTTKFRLDCDECAQVTTDAFDTPKEARTAAKLDGWRLGEPASNGQSRDVCFVCVGNARDEAPVDV